MHILLLIARFLLWWSYGVSCTIKEEILHFLKSLHAAQWINAVSKNIASPRIRTKLFTNNLWISPHKATAGDASWLSCAKKSQKIVFSEGSFKIEDSLLGNWKCTNNPRCQHLGEYRNLQLSYWACTHTKIGLVCLKNDPKCHATCHVCHKL